jgi:two-component sensor histidine kinase/integral membrane sensor domain MASE1
MVTDLQTTKELTATGQRQALRFALVALCYFVVAKLGLQLASVQPNATPIWPSTGIAIAAVLLWGYRISPAVFIAAFAINQLTAGSLFTSLGIATGNALEAVVAGYLLRRWGGGQQVFDSASGVARFAVIAVGSTAISATIGPGSLAIGGFVPADTLSQVALTWWLGDLAGALVITPVVVLWARNPTAILKPEQLTRLALCYFGAVTIGLVAFSPLIPQVPVRDLLGFFAILPLLWAGLRLEPRHTATIALILSAFAVWGTFRNGGPFASSNLNESFLLLIMFIISTAVPSLALSADLSARRRTEEQQQQQALETDVLWQASVQVATGGTFEDLLRACLERICRVARWPAGHVYLPDDQHNPRALLPSSVWHFEDATLMPVADETSRAALRLGEGLPGRIWESGEPLWIPDIAESQNLPRKEVLLKNGLHAAFGFPLFAEERLQAVLEFFSTARQPPDEHLLRIVQSIGQQLGRVLERKRAAEQQQLLVKELTHRVGNTLAVIQSIFRRSVQHARSMQELEEAFVGRLTNLSAVYRHLSESNWQSAKVADLVRAALEPYCSPRYEDCDLKGSDVSVSASMALSLMMILHELAANSAKHGAFGCEAGRLRVRWHDVGPPESSELQLSWEEFGRSPGAQHDGRGYGFTLIDSTTKALGARVQRSFRDGGISVELTIPLR